MAKVWCFIREAYTVVWVLLKIYHEKIFHGVNCVQRKWRPSSAAQCMWHCAFMGAMSIQPFRLQH